jgi:hypothetical protein
MFGVLERGELEQRMDRGVADVIYAGPGSLPSPGQSRLVDQERKRCVPEVCFVQRHLSPAALRMPDNQQ